MLEDIPEQTLVTLVWDVEGFDLDMEPVSMPEGTSGVVVRAYQGGMAYEVRFTRPYRTVITCLHYEIVRAG